MTRLLHLTTKDDFQAHHARSAVGTGSLECSRFYYRDAAGDESIPTSANVDLLFITVCDQDHVSCGWIKASDRLSCRLDIVPITQLEQLSVCIAGTAFFQLPLEHAPEDVGGRIDRIRSQLGITMTQLAEALQLQRLTLYRWYEGRQPHPANQMRVAELEAFAQEWAAQCLPPIRRHWQTKIPALNLRVRDVLTDPLRGGNALLASLDYVRSVVKPPPAIDPFLPKARRGSRKLPSARDQFSPPLWESEE